MGIGKSGLRPLATHFGTAETRGPTLGGALLPREDEWLLVHVAPMRTRVYDAHSASVSDDVEGDVRVDGERFAKGAPFTSFCSGEPYFSLGCQDGTVLVCSTSAVVHELKVDSGANDGSLAMSITAMCTRGHNLFAGACGSCHLWDMISGDFKQKFQPLGNGSVPSTPSSMCVVSQTNDSIETSRLWIGSDDGVVSCFEISTGEFVCSFSCGYEVIVSLVFFEANTFVFALSAHKRVSVWDSESCGVLHKYAAELIACGEDLSAMSSAPDSLLLLAGIDGSLCIRHVSRRADGKICCVLVWFVQNTGATLACPITYISYHDETDSVLLGDAGGSLALLPQLHEHFPSVTGGEG
jgi:WD40 repeat protein